MKSNESVLNHILVELFNEILKTEEICLSNSEFKNLSISEIHVIEAACNAKGDSNENTASSIAGTLKITAGSLSTAVSFLEKKNYLIRKKDDLDKRIVHIIPTELGRRANELHLDFHKEMVDDILDILEPNEVSTLIKSLESISVFFRKKYLH